MKHRVPMIYVAVTILKAVSDDMVKSYRNGEKRWRTQKVMNRWK